MEYAPLQCVRRSKYYTLGSAGPQIAIDQKTKPKKPKYAYLHSQLEFKNASYFILLIYDSHRP